MKVILAGHPASQGVAKISKYLIGKYAPDFDVRYVNYGGDVERWGEFYADYLSGVEGEKVIFSLDDFLIRSPIIDSIFEDALKLKPCVKLCASTEQEHKEYPVTTQYTIWNRKELIELLKRISNPWDFELTGSKIFEGTCVIKTCLDYDTHSALSKRWQGVKLDGISEEDLTYIKENGLN